MTTDASRAAADFTDDVADQVKRVADEASKHVKVFVADVKRGDPKTLGLAGVVLAGAAAVIAMSLRK